MSSSPEVLQWFLEQHPLTFPVESVLSLLELPCSFIGLTKTSSTDEAVQLSLIFSFTRLTQAYFQHLANPATARAFSSSQLNLMLHNLAAWQGYMLIRLANALDRRLKVSAKAQQLLQEMLQDTAVQQAVMLELAGGCKCLFELVEQQGKRGAKSSSSSRSNTSSTRARTSSSRAAGGAAAAPAGMAHPSSFAELAVAPDHELVAAADGKAAVVAAYAKVANMQFNASRSFGQVLDYMHTSMVILTKAFADDGRFHISAVELQLLLELAALAGFAIEKEGHAPGRIVVWAGPLTVLIGDVKADERRAFVAARGDLLLQVLGVVCRTAEQHGMQLEIMSGRDDEGDNYLSMALAPLFACMEGGGGERSADRLVGLHGASVLSLCFFFSQLSVSMFLIV